MEKNRQAAAVSDKQIKSEQQRQEQEVQRGGKTQNEFNTIPKPTRCPILKGVSEKQTEEATD